MQIHNNTIKVTNRGLKSIIFIIYLVLYTCILNSQNTERILYRGDSINIYPTDSITMVDVKLIPSLPDGKYYGFYHGDTTLLRIVIEYVNQKIEGNVVEYYYANRDTTEITGYHKGIKHGYWAIYEHVDGHSLILHEGEFDHGKKIGFQYSYYGKIDERKVYNKEFYKEDKEIYNIWYSRDSTVYFAKDSGYVYEFDRDRNIIGSGKSYKMEKFGFWKRYLSIPDIWTQGKYELWNWHGKFPDSRPIGIWEDYYPNGQLARKYKYDYNYRKSGIATVVEQYDLNGNLLDSASFVNGIGLYKEYYSSGKIELEKFYSMPDKLDYEKYYTESGGLMRIIEYPSDSIKVKTYYYSNGRIKSIENYKASIYLILDNDEPSPVDYEKFGIQKYYDDKGFLIRKENITERSIVE